MQRPRPRAKLRTREILTGEPAAFFESTAPTRWFAWENSPTVGPQAPEELRYLFNRLAHQAPQLSQKFEHFFDELYGPSQQVADQLHTCAVCIMGVAAYESGYYSNPHDISLNNPFGLTAAGGNDLSFLSVAAAASDWANEEGWRFSGSPSTTTSEFVNGLQQTPAYNSLNPNYNQNLTDIINSVQSRETIWLEEHPQN